MAQLSHKSRFSLYINFDIFLKKRGEYVLSVCKKKEPSELAVRGGSSGDVVSPATSSDSNKKDSCGQLIEDAEPAEFKTKFAPKMKAKSVLADSFDRLGSGRSKVFNEFSDGFEISHPELDRCGFYSRCFRIRDCGTHLETANGIFETGEIDEHTRLIHANFCKDRLCPMCNWRRSLKIYGQASKIMKVIGSQYQFLFLTLTVPNCAPENLNNTINSMNKGFYRMKHYKRFKSVVKGFHRVLEVTINKKNETYHPHFHVILAVDKSYLTSRDYIKHSEWLEMWRKAMNDQGIKMVNIKAIKPKLKDGEMYEESMCDAVAEVSKYAVKSSDYLGEFDKDGNLKKTYDIDTIDQRVFILSFALRNRQLSVFGGVFFDTLKAMNLDDAENGDLVHLQDDKLHPYVADLVKRYEWRAGIGKYNKVSDMIIVRGENNE